MSATVNALLSLLRLGYRFHGRFDVAVEYRNLQLFSPVGDQSKNGFLVEVDYHVNSLVRLGLGYNFSRFSDDELADLSRDSHGIFFRVVGRY